MAGSDKSPKILDWSLDSRYYSIIRIGATEMMTRITITLAPDLLASLKLAAQQDGRNVSEMIRVLVEDALVNHQKRFMRRLNRGKAKAR